MGAPTTRTTDTRRSAAASPDQHRETGPEQRDDTAPATAGTAAGRYGRPAGTGGAGALLARLRSPRHPRIWFEIALIAVSYWVYSLIRNAVPEQRAQALRNADWIWQAERALGIAVESSVNHAVNGVTWLIVAMNYYYATLHFIITIAVLVWLYRRHPGRYAPVRLALFATTGVALLGYYFFPLAPPRLMNGGGFVDTVQVHHTWGSMASGNLAEMSNQYAAMPSMHIGWSTWCGLTVALLARPLWMRALGVLYPVSTLVVIVSTANHFWLDAIGGLLCLAFGFGLSVAWYGRLPHRLPRVAGAAGPGAAGSGTAAPPGAADPEEAAPPERSAADRAAGGREDGGAAQPVAGPARACVPEQPSGPSGPGRAPADGAAGTATG